METIYHLRSDSESIASMQLRSRDTSHIGLLITHGLVGATDWWKQIESGELPLHSIHGVVSGFWLGQWGEGPAEFQLRCADGTTSKFLCPVSPTVAREAFHIGRPVEVQFVFQELKAAFNGSHETKIVVEILLD